MNDLYPKVQESLKFSADEHVILEDPISSTGTLSLMKNIEDAYAVRDKFINDKSIEDEPEKPNVEAKVVSMVTVPIYQASSSVRPLSTPIPVINLSPHKPVSSTTQAPIFIATITTTTLPPPPQQQSTTESELANLGSRVFTLELRDLPHKIDVAIRDSVKEVVHVALQALLRDRFKELPKADMKEILHQRMDELLAEKDKSHKRRRDDQDLPPLLELDLIWKKSDTQDVPPSSSKQQSDPHVKQPVKDIPMPNTANIFDSEDTDSAHLLKIKQKPEWLKPIPCDERPATPEPAWVIPSSHTLDAENNWANALATTYHAPAENSLLEKTEDIASYGISHWWFYHQKLYIDRHIADSSHKVVRTHMRILSVVSIKAYSRYGYDYLKEITPRKANYQEYTIVKKDLKNLYPSDFEDLNLLLLQGHLNHLFGSEKCMLSTVVKLRTCNLVIRHRVEDFQLGIESYQKQLNLTKLEWDAKGFEYKHDYIIIDSPRAIVFLVDNSKRKIMRFNEIYKFSDGMLINIIETLYYRVKEYKVNRLNPGMNTRFWTDKDVSRSKEFIHAIE
uniref:Uncharacterized protein n=1 Tax=Tanacetum cinerariifolium TaxID=118510 RepID=A0A6L2P6Y8_TANCI|nr:hypothetical protein [Tanacetum cinerariifolium]